MSRPLDIRRIGIALIIGIVLVAAAVPVCQMVGCSMSLMPISSAGLSSTCGGTTASALASGIVAENTLMAMLALCAAIVLGMAFGLPAACLGAARVPAGAAPPPPEGPRGVRLLI